MRYEWGGSETSRPIFESKQKAFSPPRRQERREGKEKRYLTQRREEAKTQRAVYYWEQGYFSLGSFKISHAIF